jgi:hypothetical protein
MWEWIPIFRVGGGGGYFAVLAWVFLCGRSRRCGAVQRRERVGGVSCGPEPLWHVNVKMSRTFKAGMIVDVYGEGKREWKALCS